MRAYLFMPQPATLKITQGDFKLSCLPNKMCFFFRISYF